MGLQGKVAIVTGAGTGPQAELAVRLARAGAFLVLADADGPAGRRTVLEANTGERGRAVFHPGDLSEPGFAAFLAREAESCWGGLDILAGPADSVAPLLAETGAALAGRGGALLAFGGEAPSGTPEGLRVHMAASAERALALLSDG
ncbi:MAG TPA: SDR family NAD(P)-dependent oxidoreductase [Azospirillaceae bacterium]|nr:SDR family NAD(P)-dependent oxidoreductase [Azospirillaceae bacterium]